MDERGQRAISKNERKISEYHHHQKEKGAKIKAKKKKKARQAYITPTPIS